MFAILRERGTCATVHGIGTGRGLRQCICADNLASSETRQVFLLLLLSAEINDGERADPGVSSPGRGEAGVLRNVVGDDCGGDLVHLEAAIGLRDLG